MKLQYHLQGGPIPNMNGVKTRTKWPCKWVTGVISYNPKCWVTGPYVWLVTEPTLYRIGIMFLSTGILTTKVRCVAIAAWNPQIRLGNLDGLVEMLVTKLWGKAWLLRKRNTPPWQSHVFSRHAGHKLCNYVNVSENNWYCCLACSFKLVDMLKPSGLANMEPNQIWSLMKGDDGSHEVLGIK